MSDNDVYVYWSHYGVTARASSIIEAIDSLSDAVQSYLKAVKFVNREDCLIILRKILTLDAVDTKPIGDNKFEHIIEIDI